MGIINEVSIQNGKWNTDTAFNFNLLLFWTVDINLHQMAYKKMFSILKFFFTLNKTFSFSSILYEKRPHYIDHWNAVIFHVIGNVKTPHKCHCHISEHDHENFSAQKLFSDDIFEFNNKNYEIHYTSYYLRSLQG